MRICFSKMHGAGNDFVVIDDRRGQIPWNDSARMATLANRPSGIGCEGIILVQTSIRADFRMRFLNPDGAPADMCGNGARCAARFAHRLGAAPGCMRIETDAGMVSAHLLGADRVRITLPGPFPRHYDMTLRMARQTIRAHHVTCGVPHLVIPVPDCRLVDVQSLGSALRHAGEFAPGGTNVNFVSTIPEARFPTWRLRTFERGVEAESGACGTGAMASALVLAECLGAAWPIVVRCSEAYDLRIDRLDNPTGSPEALVLEGPADDVFRGEIMLGDEGTTP